MKFFKVTVCLAALAMSAQAVKAADDFQVNVRFSDLDLARTDGAATLYARIHSAAERVCAPLSGRRLDENQRYRVCVGDALARAVADVHQPTLTEYYQSKVSPRDRTRVAVAAR